MESTIPGGDKQTHSKSLTSVDFLGRPSAWTVLSQSLIFFVVCVCVFQQPWPGTLQPSQCSNYRQGLGGHWKLWCCYKEI